MAKTNKTTDVIEKDEAAAEVEHAKKTHHTTDGNHAALAVLHRTAAAAHRSAADAITSEDVSDADRADLAKKATQASEACRGHSHPIPAEEGSIEAANAVRNPGLSAEDRVAAHQRAADAHDLSSDAHEAV